MANVRSAILFLGMAALATGGRTSADGPARVTPTVAASARVARRELGEARWRLRGRLPTSALHRARAAAAIANSAASAVTPRDRALVLDLEARAIAFDARHARDTARFADATRLYEAAADTAIRGALELGSPGRSAAAARLLRRGATTAALGADQDTRVRLRERARAVDRPSVPRAPLRRTLGHAIFQSGHTMPVADARAIPAPFELVDRAVTRAARGRGALVSISDDGAPTYRIAIARDDAPSLRAHATFRRDGTVSIRLIDHPP